VVARPGLSGRRPRRAAQRCQQYVD